MVSNTRAQLLQIAKNHTTPVDKLIELAAYITEDEEILNALVSNPNTPAGLLIELAIRYLGCCLQDKYLSALRNNPAIDDILLENPNFLENLYDQLEKYDLHIFLTTLPDKFFKIASNSCYSSLRYLAANNKNSPKEILKILAKAQEINIRAAVARNKNTPIYLLEKLAEEPEEWLRESVAENQNAPVVILKKLAREPKDSVRKKVAMNQNTPTPILAKLAQDTSISVRLAVANNCQINPQIIKLLFEDKNSHPNHNDSEEIKEAIELEIKRLNWTKEILRKCLEEKYAQIIIYFLSQEQLFDFWKYLHSLESQSYPKSLRENIFNDLDFDHREDIPF